MPHRFSIYTKLFCAIALLTALVISCGKSPDESSFDAQLNLPVQHYVNMKLLPGEQAKAGQDLWLDVSNITDDCIVFPFDYGLKIFAYQNNGWVQIPNNVSYGNQTNVTLESREGIISSIGLTIHPDLSRLQPISSPQKVRIVVVGKLCVKGIAGQQNVADYTDVNVLP